MPERIANRHGQAGNLPKIRFQLLERLEPGETAEAEVLFYSPGESDFKPLPKTGDRILVHATFFRAFGFADEQGWATYFPDHGTGSSEGAQMVQWEVTSMEGCLLRPCTAVDTINSGASGTITISGVSFEAENVTEGDVDPGDTLNAYYLPYPEEDRGWKLLTGAGGEDKQDIVRVTSPTPDPSTCLWAGKLCYINPEATAYCSDPFYDSEDIWLLVLDGDGGSWSTPKTDLVSGEKYLGRKVGAIGEPARTIYAIRNLGAGDKLVRFQLTDDLVWGTDATEPNAQIMVWDTDTTAYIAAPDTPDIIVVDYTKRNFEGSDGISPYGSRGWAQKMPDRDVYEIVWMEPFAIFVRYDYDLIADVGVLQAHYLGAKPVDGAGVEIDVADLDDFFPFNDGGKHIGFRDPANNRYLAIQAQTRAGFISFELTSELTGAVVGAAATPDDFWGTQQDVLPPPESVTIPNLEMFQWCLTGANGIAVLDNSTGEYIHLVIDQRALLLKAQASADYAADDTEINVDNVELLTPFPFGGVEPELEVVKNDYNLNGTDNDKLLLIFDQDDGNYIAFKPGGKTSRRFKATLTAELEHSSATASINAASVAALDGGDVPAALTSIGNPAGWGAQNAATVWFEEDWSGESLAYSIYNVRMIQKTIVEEVEWDIPDLKQNRIPIVCAYGGEAEEPELIVEFENFLYIEDVLVEGGVLKQTYRNGLALGIGEDTTETVFTPPTQSVVINVFDGTTYLGQTKATLSVWAIAEGSSSSIVTIDVCP